MFDHVTIRVSDRAASVRFYDTVLSVLDLSRAGDEWGDFSIVADDRQATRRLHIAFYAPTHELVDAFHQAGVDAGFTSDGAPGPRDYTPEYYGSFLLDPDGNSVEAVSLEEDRETGQIDHLWLRTTDVDAVTAFYETIAPVLGFDVVRQSPEHTQIRGGTGSFSFLRGDGPTEHVHIAFAAASDEAVQAVHAAGTTDPDGHSIEAVNRNR